MARASASGAPASSVGTISVDGGGVVSGVGCLGTPAIPPSGAAAKPSIDA